MLQDYKFKISMCSSALDNPYSERINGIIKNEYLAYHRFETLSELQKNLKQTVQHYNHVRPHVELNMMTPVEFEKHIQSLKPENRIKVVISPEHK
jgi:transposase InsO family protein